MAVTASAATTTVIVKEDGPKGEPGTNGLDGAGFNHVRYSILKNPLLHLFKTNKLATVSAPSGDDSDITWLRSTSANYFNRYNELKSAAIDEPREQKNGFLIEGNSSNLLTYCKDYENAVWIKGGVTVTDNSIVAPDGTLTASQIAATGSGGYFMFQSVTPSATVKTGSFWLKSPSPVTVAIGQAGSTSTNNKDANLTDEWQRVYITGANIDFDRIVLTSNSADTTGEVIHAWVSQYEPSEIPTSEIITTSVALTRGADDVTASVYNNAPDISNDFSFVFDLDLSVLNTSTTARRILNIKDNNLFIQFVNGGLNVGSTTGSIAATPSSEKTRVCFVSELGVSKLYFDGSLATNAPINYITQSDGLIYFGQSQLKDLHANCMISDFMAFDVALNEDEIKLTGGV